MIAVAFSCGLGLGLLMGAALWSVALWFSRQVISAQQRRLIADQRAAILSQQKRIAKAKDQIRAQYGNELSADQERVLEEELGKVFTEFPNPGIRQDS